MEAFAACGVCGLIALFIAISLAGIPMLILGSICVAQYNAGGQVDSWCPSNSGSLALLIVGAILVFCCCFGGGAKVRAGN